MSRSNYSAIDVAAVTAAGGMAMAVPFAEFFARVASGVLTGLIVAAVTWLFQRLTRKDKS